MSKLEDHKQTLAVRRTEGPKAPRDPVEKRSGFFVLSETAIEATARPEGRPSQEIYLEGSRLTDKARFTGGVTDEQMLALLSSWTGFRQLVHSIGISVKTDRDQAEVYFLLQNWGITSKYESGTRLLIPCPGDGTELLLRLEDIAWTGDDAAPGKFAFEFNHAGELATASIIFYLHDGYMVPELKAEPPVAFGSKEYRDMIGKSLVHSGNNRRLKAAMEKAEKGEDVTIAYIGGSITQGAGAKPIHTGCYAYQSYVRFKEMFGPDGGENIHYVKAGVGGTPSELGVIRYDRDILRDGAATPDIVVVEFAVNDAGDETKGNCYESLILKILAAENRPAVILLFSVFVNDWNLQERLSPVGLHYNLPMVSVKDAVTGQFRLSKAEGNVISKRQFFYDIYHPTNEGHRVMADCLAFLFSETYKSLADREDITLDKPPVLGKDFAGTRLLDRKNHTGAVIEAGGFTDTDTDLQMVEMDLNPFGTPEFPYNWMHTAAAGQDSFKLTVTSKNLILVYKDSGSSGFGQADIYVDGQLKLTANPHDNDWTHCNPVILYQNEHSQEHVIEIRMAPEDQDKCFTILGFGYND
ncbi:SGNH/GDSL hydrolase family protein [Paenibacillus sonchi]|uniref:SGNH/GDSL hydrolase family protein n=1 Tax=Paenibacillus sonchi TaxID=373687 RepID=UPI001E485A1E|nr:SGNH/GDSL hydrolase family protein [Paenibacillus sonchi]MCE3200014.1 SGNH/GDSL hydrolase family protein [Paenibacillus sonchi]